MAEQNALTTGAGAVAEHGIGALAALREQAMIQVPPAASDYLVVLPLVLCFLFGAGLLMMRKRIDWHPWLAIPGFILVLAVDVALLFKVIEEGPVTMMMSAWKPPFGIAFTVDLMGALFVTAAGFVALACAVYAVASVSRTERRYGFFPFLFLMMGGVSGAFLTGDIFNLYVWFEVLLIGSFGLLILGSQHEQLDGAVKYCFLNLVGTTLFLITTGYLYGVFGTLNMADIAMKAREMEASGHLVTLAVLYFVAFALKAAAFPLNFWLPASYHTPRFVVSALFAGLLTKVGIYAMIRILLMLFAPERADLAMLVGWVAALTMITGALGALAQTDLRRLFNYFVVAGIGTMMAGLAITPLGDAAASLSAGAGAAAGAASNVVDAATPGDAALRAGVSGTIFYALHSIVVMTALYLAGGFATRLAGSSSLAEMGGLWRRQPLFAALMLVFLFAVSGLPPFSGFWPKLMLVRATIAGELPWLAATILATGFLMTIASARVFALAFWRPMPVSATAGPTEAILPAAGATARDVTGVERTASLVSLFALAAFLVLVGVWPEWLMRLTDSAAASVVDPAAYFSSVFGGMR